MTSTVFVCSSKAKAFNSYLTWISQQMKSMMTMSGYCYFRLLKQLPFGEKTISIRQGAREQRLSAPREHTGLS